MIKTRAKKNKLFNSKMHQLYGRKWSKIKKILKNFEPTQCNEIEIHALLVVTAESHQIPYRHYDTKTKRAKIETF